MSKFNHWLLVPGFILITIIASCGYNLKGRGSSLPEHIKNIYVPGFQNDSIRYGLEAAVTEGVKKKIVNFGYKIVKDRSLADAELIGTVMNYQTIPENLDRAAKVQTLRIVITLKVVFLDLQKKRTLYENLGFNSPPVSFTVSDDPQERTRNEDEKIDESVEALADQLIQEIFTGF